MHPPCNPEPPKPEGAILRRRVAGIYGFPEIIVTVELVCTM